MNCETLEELLSAYIDGEVTAEERQTVEQHVASCVSCRATLQDFSAVQTLSKMLPVLDAPQGFRQRVSGRIEQQSRSRIWEMKWVPRFAFGTIALLLIGASVMFWHWRQTPQTQPEQYTAAIDVYAEDILFEDVSAATDSLFSTDTTGGVAEEFLDSIETGSTETRHPALRSSASNRGMA